MTTASREPASAITHGIGALLGLVGMSFLLTEVESLREGLAFGVFSTTLIMMYVTSSLYHHLKVSPSKLKKLRRLDHSMIFVFIAGSYTPYCLIPLEGTSTGLLLLSIIWSVALVGVAIKLFYINAPRWVTIAPYLAMGWLVMFFMKPLIDTLPPTSLTWLLIGGLAYSFGAIIYALKKPDPWPGVFGFHEVWHIIVMAGTAAHWVSVSSLAAI